MVVEFIKYCGGAAVAVVQSLNIIERIAKAEIAADERKSQLEAETTRQKTAEENITKRLKAAAAAVVALVALVAIVILALCKVNNYVICLCVVVIVVFMVALGADMKLVLILKDVWFSETSTKKAE